MRIFFSFVKLRDKLILSHSIAIVSVVLLIQISIYIIGVRAQIRDAQAFDTQIVHQISISLDNMIISFKRVLNSVSMKEDIQELLKIPIEGVTKKTLQYEIDNQLYSHVVQQTIMIHELDSVYLYDLDTMRVYFKRYHHVNDKEQNSFTLHKQLYYPDGKVTWKMGEDTVFFYRAIRDLNSLDIIGYLNMSIHQKYIREKIDGIASNKKRFIVVLDSEDSIITHNAEAENKLEQIVQSISYTSENSSYIRNLDSFGKSLVTTYHSEFSGWRIISVISISELTKAPEEFSRLIFSVGIVGVLLGVGFSLISSYSLVKPLHTLTNVIDEVENENFSVRVHVNTQDEIGKLGKSFNKMIEKIDILIKKVYQEELSLKEAEIRVLQAQINPHFLYNTLDCINWLVEIGKTDQVSTITLSLAQIMKLAANNKKKFVMIKEEMDYIKAYLSIYEVSLQGYFHYYIDIEESILLYPIPKLLLQPIVENAILHGIKKKISQEVGHLHIQGLQEEEKIIFRIFDDGIGMTEAEVEQLFCDKYQNNEEKQGSKGNRSGIRNVHHRLQLIYGKSYGLYIESEIGIGTMVEFQIPIGKEGERYHVQSSDSG
ncbi:MAG: histidine kinase [Epulopiscium sp.]|nr:histidine kinase [Candidatus Epulonipiscium sp.]